MHTLRATEGTFTRSKELRQTQTHSEKVLWSCLRSRALGGLKFRRQHPIGRYIVDFCCCEKRVIIEIDGDTHADSVTYDQNRSMWLENQGYQVIRFTNDEVEHHLMDVCDVILRVCSTK